MHLGGRGAINSNDPGHVPNPEHSVQSPVHQPLSNHAFWYKKRCESRVKLHKTLGRRLCLELACKKVKMQLKIAHLRLCILCLGHSFVTRRRQTIHDTPKRELLSKTDHTKWRIKTCLFTDMVSLLILFFLLYATIHDK